ncbi:MAG: glycosyltransferase family 4 protein [Pseudomonadota bacterium]|nr:glycosyltransferase family 4 protein [Pseudomonadota bacterium]
MVRKRLLIEGWRFIHHSYALVAQAHCLCILKRADVDLRFRDLPFYSDAWKPTPGIFAAEQERALSQLSAPEPGFAPEATFSMRPERPDFSAPPSGRKFVFGTAEYRVLSEENRSGLSSASEVPDMVSVVAPSRWAALAFERFGLPSERIHVVPHGIDPTVMHPNEEDRAALRGALGVQDQFVFIAVGAMTWNKGLDILLAAFVRAAETEPEVRLVLKGLDGLYPSRSFVREVLDGLPARARETVAARLVYEGRTMSMRGMAHLLRGADCYVSPYRAEGFNLPVLEAMACGVPVLCTAGGPTDEFIDAAFAQRIRSAPIRKLLTEKESGDALEPDGDHLVELMRNAARNRDRGREAGTHAARYALKNFTWDVVTERLLASLLPTSG